MPLVFEHGQEAADRRGVDVGEVEVGRAGAGLLADPREQEPERVAGSPNLAERGLHPWVASHVSSGLELAVMVCGGGLTEGRHSQVDGGSAAGGDVVDLGELVWRRPGRLCGLRPRRADRSPGLLRCAPRGSG